MCLDKPSRPTEGKPMEPASRILVHACGIPCEPTDPANAAGPVG